MIWHLKMPFIVPWLYCCFFEEKKSPPSPDPHAFNILFSVFGSFTMSSLGVIFCIYPVWGFLSFLNLWLDFSHQFLEIPGQCFRYYLPSPSSLVLGVHSLPGLSLCSAAMYRALFPVGYLFSKCFNLNGFCYSPAAVLPTVYSSLYKGTSLLLVFHDQEAQHSKTLT